MRFLLLVLNQQAALATKWKEPPRDAIDTMILIMGLKIPQVCFIEDKYSSEALDYSNNIAFNFFEWQEGGVCSDPEGPRNLKALNHFTQLDFTPFDPHTKRTEAKLQALDGSIFRISKVSKLFLGQRTCCC